MTSDVMIENAVNWLWETLGCDFADNIAVHPVDETRWRKAIHRYYSRLYGQVGFVRVLGKMESQPLEGIYTNVNVLDKLSAEQRYSLDYMREHFGPRTDAAQQQVVRKDGLAVLREHDKLFILGKPGAGKTTFMKWAALQAICNQLDYFPIFITLKALSDKREVIGSAENILDYIAKTSQVRRIPSPKTFIEYALESGKALILFDGLDEVNLEDNRRADMVAALNEFVVEYGDSKTLITCRVAATEYSFTQFEYVEMADFTPQQMGTYIDNWFSHDKDKAKRCRNELVEKSDNKALQELAQIPLLMTLLCLTFDELNAFPVKRSQIYDEATRALLSKWDASRNIRRDTIYRGLDLQEKKWMLAAVASHTFERGDYFVAEGEMTALLEDALRSIPNIENPDGEVVLKAIEAQHGILVERARHIHSFSHLTLQEYFTALHIVENARHKNYLPALMEHITDNRWREVFLLTAGMLRSAEDFFTLFAQQLQQQVATDDALVALFHACERVRAEQFLEEDRLLTRSLLSLLAIACESNRLLQTVRQQTSVEASLFIDVIGNLGNFAKIIMAGSRKHSTLTSIVLGIGDYLLLRRLLYMAGIDKTSLNIKHTAEEIANLLNNELGNILLASTLTIVYDPIAFETSIGQSLQSLRAYYGLDGDWQLDIHSYQLLAAYFNGVILYLDCLQVANVRDRQTWKDHLLWLPPSLPIHHIQTVSAAPRESVLPQVEKSVDLEQLRRWLRDEMYATVHKVIEWRIRFLEEKQRIFYIELPIVLRGAFSLADFDRMLRTRCGRSREEITTVSGLRHIVVDVISEADRQGWLVALVDGAYEENRSNQLLSETHHEMLTFLTEFEVARL